MYNVIPIPSNNHEPRLPGDPIDLIVLHATVGSYQGSLDWLRNPASEVSTHYLIGKDGRIAQLVDERNQAWHAGTSFWRGRTNLNRYSIGIELENLTGSRGFVGQDPYTQAQVLSAAWLVGDICTRRNIPRDRQHIVSHAEIAPRRKSDPKGLDINALVQQIGGRSEKVEEDVWYVVPQRVNIRQAPNADAPVASQAYRGQKLYVDAIVHGEKLMGSDLWVHMKRMPPYQFDLGFIKLELLRHGN